MNPQIRYQLDDLRKDYASVVGKPFKHFYCPILQVDEDVPLQEGHIINQAFRKSARTWVVQRKDVDNFYGTHFEADFVKLQDTNGLSHADILASHALAKKFNLKIRRNGEPVQFMTEREHLPEVFTPLTLEGEENEFKIGLKISQEELLASVGDNWEIETNRKRLAN